MEVFERASEASGLDLRGSASTAPLEELVADRGAAAGARGDEPRDPRGAARARHRARLSSSATRSASSPRSPRREALSLEDAIALVRERGLAMAEAARERPGSMAAILGLDDGSSRRSASRSRTSGRRTTTARARSSSPARTPPSTSAAARPSVEGARRTVKLRVSGAFHSPLVAAPPSAFARRSSASRFTDPRAPFMSTVTAKIEPAQRFGALLVEQLTAPVRFTQAARELIAPGRDGLRRGRARQRAQRFTEEDRPQRQGRSPVDDLACSRSCGETLALKTARLELAVRSRARPLSSPAARAGSAARSRVEFARGRRRGRRRLPLGRR